MMKRFFIVFCLCLSSVGALASDWVFIKEEKRVKTYRRDVPDSPLKQFKGEMLMNAPLSKVAHVLIKSDTETRLRWTSRLFKFSVFEEEADRLVYYTAFDLPWPIADRDYVLEGKLNIDNKNNRVVVDIASVKHAKAPPTVGVRAVIDKSSYVFEPRPGGKTFVTVDISTDPKGLLPSWLVNAIQKGWPTKTLSAMEVEAMKPGTPHHELIRQQLKVLKKSASL